MKYQLFLVVFVSTFSCKFMNGQNNLVIDKQFKDQRLKLKNLAFCKCQSKVDSNTLSINDGSAAGFKSYLAYTEDVFIDLKNFTNNWIKDNEKNYKSYDDSSLSTMKCLDYYNSKELENFVLKQNNKLDKNILKELYK